MAATFEQENNGIWTLRVTGTLRKAELDAAQVAVAKGLGTTDTVRILVIATDFVGWQRGEDWGDLTFFVEHGDHIERIAIVADPRWEEQMSVFAGAGFRKAPVKFFAEAQLAEARAWLAGR